MLKREKIRSRLSDPMYSLLRASILGSLILSGCASSQDLGMMQWDINNLRSEIETLKKAQPSSSQKDEIDRKIDDIEEKQNATSTTVNDLLMQVQNLNSEFQLMTGKFEESRYFTEKSASELLDSREAISEKIKVLDTSIEELGTQLDEVKRQTEESQKALSDVQNELIKISRERQAEKEALKASQSRTSRKTGSKKSEPSRTAAKEDSSEIKSIYMDGYQSFKEGKNKEAREKFTAIIKEYPENDYSDNARFWLGEIYYKEGSYEDAILAYEDLFKFNPGSDKIPGAMLKQGLAFYALNDRNTGKIILEKLIEKFPNSEHAKLAQKKISRPSLPKKKK